MKSKSETISMYPSTMFSKSPIPKFRRRWGLYIGFISLGFLVSDTAMAQITSQGIEGGMVSADNPDAARVGADILSHGGDAVDAAVATVLALGVVHAFGSGIGGGGFAVVTRASGERLALDFREVAPAAAHKKMFIGPSGKVIPEASTLGPKAAGVPGELAGLYALHQRHGKLPWKTVVMPAVKLARDGFKISPLMHHKMKTALYHLRPTVIGPYLVDKNEATRAPGMMMRLPPLAHTLERIAEHGAHDFYRGQLAEEIVKAIRANGGLITAKDLASYQVKERPLLVEKVGQYEVLSMPPPSSGGLVLLQVLKVLDLASLKLLGHNSAPYLHQLTESLKHAFADRARAMGDPDFVPVPRERFLGNASVDRVRKHFNPAKTFAAEKYGASTHIGEDGGTSHVSVVDAEGNAVALTTTINTGFGSRFVAGGTGIVLNNQMDDFVAQPGVPNSFGLIGEKANAIEPKKRPLSSMSPTIVFKGRQPILVIGASGGPMIITSTLQVMLNILVFGMAPETAVRAPRIHHQWMPNTIKYEVGIKDDVLKALQTLGHDVTLQERYSATQVIHLKDGQLLGAADPSKGGQAVPSPRRIGPRVKQ